ncbi:MAG: protein translocase subunit SecDF [Bacteroidales bacterium]
MQNKGAIRFFTILLAIVSVYQLLFTVFVQKVEKDARKVANGDVRIERSYLDSMKGEVIYNVLFRKYTYLECKEREVNLGLDLKGGMNVILEIAVEDIIKSIAAPQYLTDPMFTETIALAHQKKANSQADFVNLFAEAFEELNPGAQLAQFFMTPETRGSIDFNTTNQEVVDYLKVTAEGAIDNSYNVLRNRIDRFGVVQLNIQKLERQGRILVELPGVKEPERVTKLLTGTANLEFWTTYQASEAWNYLDQANRSLSAILITDETAVPVVSSETEISETADTEESILEIPQESLLDTTGLDLLTDLDSTSVLSDEAEQFYRENPLLAVLTPYLDNQRQFIPGSTVGVVLIKDTAKVNDYLAIPQIKQLFPSDMIFAWHFQAEGDNQEFIRLHALKATRNLQPVMEGKYVTDARVGTDPYTGEFNVSMNMNSEGAKKWANVTRENVGQSIAIVLDGLVYSAPNVNEEIKGGSSSISGQFTQTDADDLANILKSGKMPARARVESSEVIGPTLGAKSVKDGMNSFLIAFVVVLAYMIFYYSRRAGTVADIALIANMFFLMGVLASLQAVLTLPGIAGIVLTIGMSVDANVLIYERIREEINAGKNLKTAIKDGYNNAYSAIFDSQITTFLTGLILFFFGTGPIKGFATTLVIGILTSLFSAIILTRLMYERMLTKGWNITFDTKLTRNFLKNTKINFLGRRKIFYVISGLVIVTSVVSLATRGLNLGVDFTGGRNYVIAFPQDVETTEIKDHLKVAFGEDPTVITYGNKSTVRVTTKYLISDDRPEVDSIIIAQMFDGLKPYLKSDAVLDDFLNGQDYIISAHKVGPTIADDIKRTAVIVVVAALLVIFLYILSRFRNWQFGFGALVALVHDVVIVIGVFSLFYGILPFSLELDQSFIAAILTVVGYSINDTVVVFDRIREYMGLQKKRDRGEVFNAAVNATLSRTLSTSLSTMFVVLAIFIFGGDVIRGFTFALLVGIGVGTYSSIFIATPVVFDTLKNKKDESTVLKGTVRK